MANSFDVRGSNQLGQFMTASWIQELPKICLHEHLDGSLRPTTVAALAEAEGVDLPCAPAELADWFFNSSNSGSLVDYLATFGLTVAVLQRPENLERVAHEFVEDLAADGVIYAEVRWAPELHLQQGASGREVVAGVWRGLQSGMASAATRGHRIVVRQILGAMRHAEPSTWTSDLAASCTDQGVVGFDLAGPEIGFSALRFANACEVAKRAGLGLTLHAGEAVGPDSIADALKLGATRLGHGVRIVEDLGNPIGEIARAVLDRGVTLEVCPTSNLMTGVAQTLADHPITRLRSEGFRVSISCDNRLMSRTTATHELSDLVDQLDWTLADCLDVQRAGLDAAFCSQDVRNDLRSIIDAYASKVPTTTS